MFRLDTLTNQQNDTFEAYWYHTDHLGSSSWITYSDGSAVQHLHYLPWGEDFVNKKSSSFEGARYTFSAKEKDAETQYSYFGAQYYSSELSIWLSVDPMAHKYPHQSNYVYCRNNPIRLIDPNGMFDIETGTIEKGDNLTEITRQLNKKFGTNFTVQDVAKANGIEDVDKIKVGNKIILPGQNAELNFDLKTLKVTDMVYGVDMPGLSWDATSGRDGYQSSEFQYIANKGPIPEGSYMVDPANTQSMISDWKAYSKWDGGCWSKGGKNAWGTIRTWITPTKETNTHGRSGFSIHGGKDPGSAGCIDLTNNNNKFHAWLKSYGRPVKLNVNYQ